MPQIIVTSDPAGPGRSGEVMHREWVDVADFESAHFRAQLLERLGWAIRDAHAAECFGPPSSDTAVAHDVSRSTHTPGRTWALGQSN